MNEKPDRETPLLGEVPAMRLVRELVARVAVSDAPVLLRGESGTGKEVAARLIHRYSRRREAQFLRLNCAAIPAELLESELFGYEPGAFTGAARRKLGKFEIVSGGTLMLDEIGEMQPGLQAKLLHVLQDGEFSRLGGEQSQTAGARILAASNVALERAVATGQFRPDLFYRLNVVVIWLPPLRERRDDIPLLAEHLLSKHGSRLRWQTLAPEVQSRLLTHNWPGNVRELENLIRRTVILDDERQVLTALREEVVPYSPVASEGPVAPAQLEGVDFHAGLVAIGKRAAWEAERRAILAALEKTRWNRRRAAELLHVSYKALHNKLRALKRESILTPVGEPRVGPQPVPVPVDQNGAGPARRASA